MAGPPTTATSAFARHMSASRASASYSPPCEARGLGHRDQLEARHARTLASAAQGTMVRRSPTSPAAKTTSAGTIGTANSMIR